MRNINSTFHPLVTISIPTYNSGKFLEKCLQAIDNQTYKNIEINIIDGNSKDNTLMIAKKYNIRELKSYSGALLGARYKGIELAKGKFVLLLDSDQILESDAIERAVDLVINKNYKMLILEEEVYKQTSLVEKLFAYDRILIHKVKDIDPYTGTMLPRFYELNLLKKALANIPTSLLRRVGGQDHAIIYFEAWNITQSVGILPHAVKHIEPDSINQLLKKFYRWGYTSVDAHYDKYDSLLAKKERFRSGLFANGLYKESFASLVLLILKGIPFKIGYFKGKLLG